MGIISFSESGPFCSVCNETKRKQTRSQTPPSSFGGGEASIIAKCGQLCNEMSAFQNKTEDTNENDYLKQPYHKHKETFSDKCQHYMF